MSEAIKERIRCPSMLKKVTYNPEDVTKHIFDGMHMGWSGFTGVGYPKVNHQYNEISWNSERLKIKKKKKKKKKDKDNFNEKNGKIKELKI